VVAWWVNHPQGPDIHGWFHQNVIEPTALVHSISKVTMEGVPSILLLLEMVKEIHHSKMLRRG